ncbi:tripartite tricarboxylate transporter substrate-binding protein [Hominifimenecus sp. rT4P-3]|uniref:tripartite tricarboxylate transporter substrate-binding protein n=1 Tax=Hominifimenecus sp. rT4P-3 TaxID=3242979 RepID=UPI003DA390C4
MKRWIALLMAVLMVLALAGCQGKENSTEGKGNGSAAETTAGSAAVGSSDETWPEKDITVVVPWKAGASLDTAARLLCQHWSKHLGVAINVENHQGANGQVGTTYFLEQPDDGSYLTISAQMFLSSSIVLQGADYSLEDIAMLNYFESDPAVIAVGEASSWKTFEELDAAIKANPGTIKVGVATGGGAAVLLQYLIEKQGWDVKVIYYDGADEARTALLGGHIDFMSALYIASVGTAEVLLYCGDEKPADYPNATTLKELVGDDAPILGTYRYVGVPSSFLEKYPERYQKLVSTLEETFQDTEYLAALEQMGRKEFTHYYGPERSEEMNQSLHELTVQYQDALSAGADK